MEGEENTNANLAVWPLLDSDFAAGTAQREYIIKKSRMYLK